MFLNRKKVNGSFLALVISALFSIISVISYGQTLSTFDGLFPNGKSQQGYATYKYYEDPETREFLKQGAFSYTFAGKGEYEGLNQTITGNYNKGRKDGTWTYKISMIDYNIGSYFHTGTISMVTNYKNGLADGNWTEKFTDKAREKYFQYGQYYWRDFEPTQTFTTIMNFKSGKIVGNVDITDVNFRAKGSYDDNSYTIGTWKINFLDKDQNLEITYKDNYMIDFTGRNAAGEILDGSTALYPKEAAEDFKRYSDVKAMTEEQKEDAGFVLDTFCNNKNVATKYIKDYFGNMMSNDWFLYKYTKGDYTFNYYDDNYQIPGGCNLVVKKVNYGEMKNDPSYKSAEEAFSSGKFIDAVDKYFRYKEETRNNQYENFAYKTSELRNLDQKIIISLKKADSLSKIYMTENDFSKYNLRFSSNDYNKSNALADFERISKLLNYDFSTDFNKIFTTTENQKSEYYGPFNKSVWENIEKYKNFWELETKKCYTQKYNRTEITSGKRNTGNSTTFCSCKEDELIKTLSMRGIESLDMLKTALLLVQNFESKVNKIESLNLENSTKLLYDTYLPFLADFKKEYSESNGIVLNLQLLKTINLSLDKIIDHYAAEPKAIDKLLKKALTKDEQKAILFQ